MLGISGIADTRNRLVSLSRLGEKRFDNGSSSTNRGYDALDVEKIIQPVFSFIIPTPSIKR